MDERTYTLYTFPRRDKDVPGKRLDMTWSDIVDRLSRPTITSETQAEYWRLPKDPPKGTYGPSRSSVKDVGGFIGGSLKDGVRSKDALLYRDLLTIDDDDSSVSRIDDFLLLWGDLDFFVYPTHSYTDEHPRYRWVFPLSRHTSSEEYRSICRYMTYIICQGDVKDDSTDQPTRLMYWPSCSKDGFDYNHLCVDHRGGTVLNVDDTLEEARENPDFEKAWRRNNRPDAPVRTGGADGDGDGDGGQRGRYLLPDSIPVGSRDNELTRIAGYLRHAGLGESEILLALQGINQPPRMEEPLPDEDLERISRSVSRYKPEEVSTALVLRSADEDFADLDLVSDCDPQKLQEAEEVLGLTDSLIANTIYRSEQDNILYGEGLGWMIWDGNKYVPNDHRASLELTKWVAAARVRLRDEVAAHSSAADMADKMGEPDEATSSNKKAEAAKALLAFISKYGNRGKREAALKDWSDLCHASTGSFDADPFMLNTPEGAYDLRTGECRPSLMSDRFTHCTACAPGSKGEELWQDFLDDTTGGDAQLQEYLQELFGLAAVGKVIREGLYIIIGNGGTGKSTMVNAIRDVLGDYGSSTDPDVFRSNTNINTNPERAAFRGRRMIVAGELPENIIFSGARLKQITSTDDIVATPKYKDPMTFKPSHTVIMYTNFLPQVGSTDEGTWRRLVLIPIDNRVDPAKIRPNFGDTLVREAGPAILRWIINGAVKAGQNGYVFPTCEVVQRLTAKYRTEENLLAQFVSECCVEEPGARYRKRELTEAYNDWARRSCVSTKSSRVLAHDLKALGYEAKHGKNFDYWDGLRPIDYQDERENDTEN